MESTDHLLGEALGQLYVAREFPPEAKARADALVRNVKETLRERLARLDWMSPQTRKEALKKLDAIAVKIGYPVKWRDYSGLAVDQDVYAANVLAAVGKIESCGSVFVASLLPQDGLDHPLSD